MRAIMTPLERVATVTPQDDAGMALGDLASREVDQLPVVENGRDIQRWLELQGEQAASDSASGSTAEGIGFTVPSSR